MGTFVTMFQFNIYLPMYMLTNYMTPKIEKRNFSTTCVNKPNMNYKGVFISYFLSGYLVRITPAAINILIFL